ncbi:MAG: hypothetical protein U0836_07400 [Pirellulales bacterium]
MPSLLRPLCAVLLLLSCARSFAAEPGPSLNVMTFNLRYASDKGPNSWPERRPVVREVLQKFAPDVIGTQEGVYHQLRDIAADSPEYAWLGVGRGEPRRVHGRVLSPRAARAAGVRPLLAL